MTAADTGNGGSSQHEEVTRKHVAKGALLATLGRLSALVDAVSQPVYSWLFGLATYGVYTVLWSTVNIVENIVDWSLTSALQRSVPGAEEEAAHAAVRFSLLVTVVPAAFLSLLATLFASQLAGFVSAAPQDVPTLPTAIRIFAWTLPCWTFVEVATSAARARRAFGPEIRLRLFWEQLVRLIFALVLFLAGFHRLGIFVAHLISLFITALLCVRLLGRYYDLKLLVSARLAPGETRQLMTMGIAILPSAIARRMFSDLPPVILNLMLPGAGGAAAAGLFGAARKIASIPLIIRQAFQYVMQPLSSAQAKRDRKSIEPLHRFASRMSTALVVPLSGLLIVLAPDILSVFKPEFRTAVPLVVVLVLGRAIEAIVGPASSVVEMIGHRGLPTLNSVLGLGTWAILAFLLVPSLGGMGMAIGVSAGTVLIAWAATLELRISDGVRLVDRKLLRGIAVSVVGVLVMAGVGMLLRPLGGPVRAGVLLIFFYPLLTWIGLRIGLGAEDRRALGKLGRKLRLSPRTA